MLAAVAPKSHPPELFDAHPVPMWVYDPDTLRFLAVNSAAVVRYGYTRDEFLRMTLADIRPAGDRPALADAVRDARGSDYHPGGRWRHRTKDGRLVEVEITSHRVTHRGTPARLVLAQDVTDRVRAEAAVRTQAERFERIAAVAPGVLHSFRRGPDGEMSFPYAGPGIADLLGRPAAELAADATAVRDLVHPDDRARLDAAVDASARDLTPLRLDYRSRHPDRGEVWVEVLSAPVREVDGAVVWHGFLNDVTARKRAEADREALILKLEDQNAELERFVYTVSHDLKTPLITIKGFLGHLDKAARAGDWGRFADDLGRVGRAADKMHHLLADLLHLSRVGRAAGPAWAVPVADAVADALQQVAGPVAAAGAEVRVGDRLPVVRADPTRLAEVFVNLIANAVKFRGDQPRPRIEVGYRPADRVVFVRDNGVGIDPAYHQRVFGLFERLDPRVEGTGVGLAIVKRIVEVHRGRVWVESAGVGHGTAICMSFPPAEPIDIGPGAGPAAPGVRP